MPVTEIGDPRLQALFGANDPRDAGVRPTVRLARKGLPPLALAAIMLAGAVLLFVALNARRTRQPEPAVAGATASAPVAWEAPPALYVPPVQAPVQPVVIDEQRPAAVVAPVTAPAPAPVIAPRVVYTPQPVPQPLPPPVPMSPPRASSGAALVIDGGAAATGAAHADAPGIGGAGARTGGRVRASALANRSMTVPQGYLIPAVLESGFDSTRPGLARAIVSRDVRGFDGKNVLIPRGSRLIGDYRSDTGQAQKRAIITWTRLIRPDGMTIALDSPAVDTLGRGGVPATVNTHFLQRLGDALLQSTVGLGSALVQRQVTGPVVVLPGAGTAGGVAAPSLGGASAYVPTLTVPPGTSISIFVARDLDFTSAGSGL